ncbi:LysM peptidoglycan-binding domain-containing protein [Megasphaera elsdenii]|uniref:LysM peptidoglycan-binding domain-containing protein n=1 Tax=Megasphaera elsdenii TaxID=907 RepID=UPI00242F0355|nr:LysM peptidoglycan-binding domain-containing protein [Megasphaera elsdenii]
MKKIEIRDHRPKQKKKSRVPGLIRAGLTFAAACGIGILIGRASNVILPAATLTADNSTVHVVQDGETLWQIARPIADEEGQDIREIIYQLTINNELDQDGDLKPGQKLIIRY